MSLMPLMTGTVEWPARPAMVPWVYTRAMIRSHMLESTLAWSRTSSLKMMSADAGGKAFSVRNWPPN